MRLTPAQAELQIKVIHAVRLRPGASAAFVAEVTGARRQAVDEVVYIMMRSGLLIDRGSGRIHAYYMPNSGAGASTTLRGATLALLNEILREDGASAADLVEKTGLSKSEVSRLGSRLHEAGVIEPLKLHGALFYVPIGQVV